MKSIRVLAFAGPTSALLFAVASTRANPEGSDATASGNRRDSARRHFEAAKQSVQQRRYEEAAREFCLAYEAVPHHSVLYNLGQAHIALGQNVEATETLTRYLEEGGARIPARRRDAVNADLARLRATLTLLRVESVPTWATVSVDGRGVGRTPLSSGVLVAAGRRRVELDLEGYIPGQLEVELPGGGTYAVTVTLTRANVAPPVTLATLDILCPVPDARVRVDDRPPLDMRNGHRAFALAPGVLQLAFEREGYQTTTRRVDLTAAGARVDCGLEPLPGGQRGRLSVRVGNGVVPSIDGQPVSSAALPPGRHQLEVRTPSGTWTAVVAVAADEHREVSWPVFPGERPLAASRRNAYLEYALLGTGAVLGIAAATTYWISEREFDRFHDAQDLDEKRSLGSRVDRLDAATAVLAGASSAFLASGGALLAVRAWWPDRSHKGAASATLHLPWSF